MSEEITNALMDVLRKQVDAMPVLTDMDVMTLPFRREAITALGMQKITPSGVAVMFTNMRKPQDKAQHLAIGCQYEDKYGRLWTVSANGLLLLRGCDTETVRRHVLSNGMYVPFVGWVSDCKEDRSRYGGIVAVLWPEGDAKHA